MEEYFQFCIQCGTPAEWFEIVAVAGPLASFESAVSWVEHPYNESIALVGDAAANVEPA